LLAEADIMLDVGLNDAAGRTAYLAGFHAAQAFIFERDGKVFKTHHGVQTEFLRLTKDDPRVDGEMRLFLSRTYNLKAIADYETGPGSDVSAERAAAAVEDGKRFVTHFAALVSGSKQP
jgi:uncharacterized protein (UPF0332 family)